MNKRKRYLFTTDVTLPYHGKVLRQYTQQLPYSTVNASFINRWRLASITLTFYKDPACCIHWAHNWATLVWYSFTLLLNLAGAAHRDVLMSPTLTSHCLTNFLRGVVTGNSPPYHLNLQHTRQALREKLSFSHLSLNPRTLTYSNVLRLPLKIFLPYLNFTI